MKKFIKPAIVLTAFGIAMAVLEAAIVVYLRALYYPGAFTVALKVIDQRILLVEIAREAATIVMLLTIAWVAGRNFRERFAWFVFCFAIWDIFYYVWLVVFIQWPASIMDWDILFLIPFTWLGPVAAPVICSVTMILLSIALLKRPDEKILPLSWLMLIVGSSLILFTFTEDYGRLIIGNGFIGEYATIMRNKEFIRIASQYIPESYGWKVFFAGELLILTGVWTILQPAFFLRSRIVKLQTAEK